MARDCLIRSLSLLWSFLITNDYCLFSQTTYRRKKLLELVEKLGRNGLGRYRSHRQTKALGKVFSRSISLWQTCFAS